jgi:hypothetical protein
MHLLVIVQNNKINKHGIFSLDGHFMLLSLGLWGHTASFKEKKDKNKERERDGVVLQNGSIISQVTWRYIHSKLRYFGQIIRKLVVRSYETSVS